MSNAVRKLSESNIFWISLLAIPAIWALFIPGFYGASDDLHIAWLHQMDKVLKMGQIPPRYVPDLSFGFGYPLFNFVFPLPFYFAEIFHLLSFSFVDSIKAVFILSLPISGIFMYLLLKEFINKRLSIIGAVLYIYTPYRAVDIYIRGAIGEIVSFVFLPLIVLSLIKIAKGGSLRWIGIGAIALASLVLSHNIVAYMFFPFTVLLILVQRKKYLNNIFAAIFLGLLASAYFWLPAIWESSLLKYDTVFNFVDHFPTVKQLFTQYWGYGASVPGPYDGMSFFLGIVNIGILVLAIPFSILSWKRFEKGEKGIIVWSVITIASAIFLMNYRSTFIWRNFPLLPYFQFPWRFLTMTTFFIPLLLVGFKYIKVNRILTLVFISVILLTSWSYFKPQDFLGRTDSYYLNRYIPVPKASEEYRKTREEYLRLPKAAQVRPDVNYPTLFSANHPMADVQKINDLHFLVSLYSENQVLVNFNKYYFPGWFAKLDGKTVEIKPGSPFGQISIPVPKGVHRLEVFFTESTFRRTLDFASLAALLISLGLIFKTNFFKI